MQPERYAVYIRWSWGAQSRFQEEYKFTSFDRNEEAIKEAVRVFAERVAKRYCFDCGRRDLPMNPVITSVRIVPEFEAETFYDESWTQNSVFSDYYTANPPEGVRDVPLPCATAVASLVDEVDACPPTPPETTEVRRASCPEEDKPSTEAKNEQV